MQALSHKRSPLAIGYLGLAIVAGCQVRQVGIVLPRNLGALREGP
jgi:hypothetical protein